MASPPKPKPRGTDDARAWTKYMGLGVQLAGTIGLCIALGIFLDGYFATNPWITVALSLVGVCGGLYVAIKDLL